MGTDRQTDTHTQTTPTRGRIIVADGIYSVGDKNIPNPTDSFIEREFARVRVKVGNEWMSCLVREELRRRSKSKSLRLANQRKGQSEKE